MADDVAGLGFFCKRHERGKQAIYFEGKLVKWFAGERLSRRKTAQGLLLHLTVYALAVVCREGFFFCQVEHSVLLKPKFPYQTRSHSSASKCRKVSRQTPGGAEGLASGPQSAAIPYNARSSAIPNADRTAEERGGGKPASGVSGEFGVWESVGGTIFHFPRERTAQ